MGGRQVVRATPAARSAQVSASAQQPADTTVVRDELVRAVMPDLQALVRHLVDTAVERATTQLLDKQRELELEVKELRSSQARPGPAPVTSTKHTAEPAQPARSVQAQFVAPVAAVMASPAPAVGEFADSAGAARMPTRPVQFATTAAHDLAALDDIPLELNGSRRKKMILWSLAVMAVLSLLATGVLSIMSNRGLYL